LWAAGVVTGGSDSKGDQIKIFGGWSDTGAGAIDLAYGDGFTVAYTGVGNYTVTFTQGFRALQSARCGVSAVGAAVDQYGQVGAFTAGAAGACTLEFWNCTGAGQADVANGDFFMFEATLISEWLD